MPRGWGDTCGAGPGAQAWLAGPGPGAQAGAAADSEPPAAGGAPAERPGWAAWYGGPGTVGVAARGGRGRRASDYLTDGSGTRAPTRRA